MRRWRPSPRLPRVARALPHTDRPTGDSVEHPRSAYTSPAAQVGGSPAERWVNTPGATGIPGWRPDGDAKKKKKKHKNKKKKKKKTNQKTHKKKRRTDDATTDTGRGTREEPRLSGIGRIENTNPPIPNPTTPQKRNKTPTKNGHANGRRTERGGTANHDRSRHDPGRDALTRH